MGILDYLYPQYGNSGLLNFNLPDGYGGFPGVSGGFPAVAPPPVDRSLVTGIPGDPSGSTPITDYIDPYSSPLMPRQTATSMTESYSPSGQGNSPLAALVRLFLPRAEASPTPPQYGAGAKPMQFPNLGGLPAETQSAAPQQQQAPAAKKTDIAPNGLDREMTVLPPGLTRMDGTNPANLNIAGYTPSPSALEQLPPKAIPAQLAGYSPPPAQDASPGIGERLQAGFSNIESGGNPISALFNVISGFSTGQRHDKAGIALQNQKAQFQGYQQLFLSRGLPKEQAASLAMVAALNPKIADEILKAPTTFEGAMVNPYSGQGGVGGGNGGNVTKTYLDFIRQKNAAEKAGTTEGEKVATAQMDLPSAVAAAKEQLRLLDELKAHPGRKQIGWHDYLGTAPLLPSSKGYDANTLLEQIKGGTFLEAYKALKGGGQITEVEGKKATVALNRMERALSKAAFDAALEDYRGIIQLGIDRANQQAGQPAPGNFRGNIGWTEIKPGIRIRKVQ